MLEKVHLLAIVACLVIAFRFGGLGLILAMALPIRVDGLLPAEVVAAPAEIVAPVALSIELLRARHHQEQGRLRKDATPSGLQLTLYALVLLFGLATFWSVAPGDTLDELAVWASTLAIASTTYLYGRRVGASGIRAWLVSGVVLLATGAIWSAIGFPSTWAVMTSFDEGDVFGGGVFIRAGHPFIGRSTYYASFAVAIFILAMSARAWPALRISALALSAMALWQTESFGALLAVAVGSLVVVSITVASRVKRFVLWVACITSALFASAYFEATRSMSALDGNGRLAIYHESIRLILDRFLIGYGPGTWRSMPVLEFGTHSLALTVLLEVGLVGLVLAIVFLGLVLSKFWTLDDGPIRTAGLACTIALVVNVMVQASAEGLTFREYGTSLIAFLIGAGVASQAAERGAQGEDRARDDKAAYPHEPAIVSRS